MRRQEARGGAAVALATAALCLLVGSGVWAADKSGVSPNTLSLPSGPGSIEGLGESFEPSLNAGTAKYGFKIALPPGPARSGPSINPRYEGGSGNGPLGFGWRLGVASIQRQSDKGIPRYVDSPNGIDDDGDGLTDETDETDTFITESGEELVPTSTGAFFCENEGAFLRYRRVPGSCADAPATQCLSDRDCAAGGSCSGFSWEADLPDGTRVSFGATPQARIVDAPTGRTFEWLAERAVDPNGNATLYKYRTYPGDQNENQKYLAGIAYGPGPPGNEGRWPAFHFVAFGYEPRSDWFEDGRPGFLVRTGMRLREVDVGTQGVTLDPGVAGDFNDDGVTDHLVRRYVLSYSGHTHWSLLTRVQQVGSDGVSTLPPMDLTYTVANPPPSLSAAGGAIGGDNEPPLVMDNDAVELIDLDGDALPDVLRTDPFGGPHVVYRNRGERLDTGDGRNLEWDAGVDVGGDARAGNFNLAEVSDAIAHLADMDGDGLTDFAYHSPGGDTYYFANSGRLSWGDRVLMNVDPADSTPPSPFGSGDVKTADLDFDKRTDIVQSIDVGGSGDYRIWFNRGGGRYATSRTVPQTAGYLLSESGVHIADVNGDRVPDIAQIRPTGVRVTAGLGYGSFAPERIIALGDWTLDSDQVARAKLEDVTGDGLVDLVLERAAPGELWYWINLGNYTLDQRRVLADLPAQFGVAIEVRWADMNGNGTTDLVYADSAGSPRLQTIDVGRLIGCEPSPHLLTTISNGIGAVTEIAYASSSAEYLRDQRSGRRWRTRLAFPVDVIVRRTISFGLDLDGIVGPDEYVTEYRYHDGYYDGREKEFRGFGEVEVIEHGDASAPTLVTRHRFHTGAPDGVNNDGDGSTDEFTANGGAEEESLKGKVLETRRETCAGTCSTGGACSSDADCGAGTCMCGGVGEAFDHVFHRWEVRRLYAPNACSGDPTVGCCADADCQVAGLGTCQPVDAAHPGRLPATTCVAGKGVHFAVETGARTAVIERAVGPRRDLFVGLEFDDYGNKTREENWGVVEAPDLPPFGCTLVSGICTDASDVMCSTDADCAATCERRSLTDGNQVCGGDPFAFFNPAEPIDQRFTRTRYANNADGWLLRYHCESDVTADAPGTVVESQARQYYDELGLCEVSKGNPTLREEWLDSDGRWIARVTNQFDAFGNILEAQDARGNRRTLEYDPKFHTYPVLEQVHLDGYSAAPLPDGQEGTFTTGPYTLSMTAEYHQGFGTMTRSTSWGIDEATGPASLYRYDVFGRLVATVSPGDSLAAPTAAYEYRLADPDAADVLGRSLNSVVSRRRETAGGGTVDAYAYVDGVGHKLGTKAEGDESGEWIYSGAMGFSRRGNENRSWLEYATSSPDYEPPDPARALVAKRFDEIGRVVRATSPATAAPGEPAGGAYSEMTYAPLATDTHDENDTAMLTPGDHMTHEKDGLDRLIHVVERNHINCGVHCGEYHTRYSYDARGNLTRILDAQSNQKLVDYDSLSRKTFMNDPNRGHLKWEYDDTDNVVRTLDAKGQENVFTYDRANRLLTEDYLDAEQRTPDVSYVYDHPVSALDMGDNTKATARLTAGYASSVYDLSGEEHTSYDERRRPEWNVKRARDPKRPSVVVSYATRMAYDSMDRATELVYPDGDRIDYGYGPRGLLTGIGGSGPAGQEIVRNVKYRPSGQLASIEYGSGAVTTYDYDARQRLNNLLTTGTGLTDGQDLVHFGYQFDPESNITAITDQRSGASVPVDSPRRNSQQFGYDGLHRLTGFVLSEGSQPGAGIDYLYDKLGNMTSAESDIPHVDERTGLSLTDLGTMAYGGSGGSTGRDGRGPGDPPGPHALTSADGRSYPYDANGNMTEIDGQVARWDHKDRLVAVERPGMQAGYVYDYTDRRITKRVRSTNPEGISYDDTTTYVNRYFELRESGQPTKYVWMGDTRVAQIEATLDSAAPRVQRLSLYEGWNLLTLAVTPRPNPLRLGVPGSPIVEAHRWRHALVPEYEPIAADTPIAPSDILWVHATRDVELSVAGAYDPLPSYEMPFGDDAGYAPWPWLEPTQGHAWARFDSSLWFFDASRRDEARFRLRPPGGVTDIASDYPEWLGPGSVFFWKNYHTRAVVQPAGQHANIRFYHQDHLGSTVAVSDLSGWLDEEVAYYPYGELRHRYEPPRGVPRQAYLFTQKERDGESLLQYYERRFRVGTGGAFLSVDPLVPAEGPRDPQLLNAYSYGRSSPVVLGDPTGYSTESVPNCVEITSAEQRKVDEEVAGREAKTEPREDVHARLVNAFGGDAAAKLVDANEKVYQSPTAEIRRIDAGWKEGALTASQKEARARVAFKAAKGAIALIQYNEAMKDLAESIVKQDDARTLVNGVGLTSATLELGGLIAGSMGGASAAAGASTLGAYLAVPVLVMKWEEINHPDARPITPAEARQYIHPNTPRRSEPKF